MEKTSANILCHTARLHNAATPVSLLVCLAVLVVFVHTGLFQSAIWPQAVETAVLLVLGFLTEWFVSDLLPRLQGLDKRQIGQARRLAETVSSAVLKSNKNILMLLILWPA